MRFSKLLSTITKNDFVWYIISTVIYQFVLESFLGIYKFLCQSQLKNRCDLSTFFLKLEECLSLTLFKKTNYRNFSYPCFYSFKPELSMIVAYQILIKWCMNGISIFLSINPSSKIYKSCCFSKVVFSIYRKICMT